MDCNPPREEERIPRPLGVRGTRGGAAAQRKRKAYQIYIFLRDQDLGIFADPSEVPFRRPDGSTRSVVRRPRTAPFQAVEEQSEVIVIDDQAPETPPPSTPVRPFHRLHPSTVVLKAKTTAPSPPPASSSSSSSTQRPLPAPKPLLTPSASLSSDIPAPKTPPKAPPRSLSSGIPVPKTPPKAPPRVPEPSHPPSAQVLHRVPEPSHPPPPQVTGNPRVIDFRPLKTEVLDFEGVKVKLTEPAFERFSFGLSLDFHGVLDRYHKKSTSWTDPRPEFPSECVAALRDLHSLIPRYGGLFFVCSYCHHEEH